ncbi:CDP-alcohol phosphatidyltransferase family protein [Pseudactinotalea sp. Z1732]|uniref:CDP-alcohol phosphatidyltransferase family protein n=1 Tax=Pseudactinotalea sp. Z1732 TaxID=3413026 RepID=UPI003C79DC51
MRQRADPPAGSAPGAPGAGRPGAARDGEFGARGGDTELTAPGAGATDAASDRILTVPNVISALRLLMVPVVAVLILSEQYLAAVVVLALAGISDWVDGVIARALDQTSRLGRLLDPAADRLFIAVVIIGLAVQQVVPWWLLVAVFARDLVVGLCVPFLVARGFPGFPVHDIGKAGTFALMYAFPVLLLTQVDQLTGHLAADIAWAFGWASALWGVYLYWCAGLAYLNQFRAIVVSDARASTHQRGPRSTPGP